MTVVTDYITFQEPHEKKVLRRLYEVIYDTLDGLEDTFKYGVPTILYKGKPLIGFASNKNYMSLYPYGTVILESSQTKQKIANEMAQHGYLYIMTLAFIPNPLFDAAGIVAGSLRYDWRKFFSAALIGKTLKMLLVAIAGSYSLTWLEGVL